MRKIDVEELKQTQLEILDVVAKFCEDNQINYWIDAGTLLGAIRHKGFIPWDDDIDVGMLRPDYDKFMKLFNEKNTRYKFHCIENDPKFTRAWGRVFDTDTILYDTLGSKWCINIDVLVYYNAPDEDKIVNEMYDKRDLYHKWNLNCLYNYHHSIFRPANGNLLRRLCVYTFRALFKLFPKSYFARKTIKNSRRYISQNTKRVGNFTSYSRMTCDKRVFNEFIDVEFEGRKFKAPVGYDEWLRSFYGDYMQLPPVEKQVYTHNWVAYKK